MKELRETYFSMQAILFPVLEEEKIEFSGKMKEFVELVKAVKPARFLNNLLHWRQFQKSGKGIKKSRLKSEPERFQWLPFK